MSILVKKRHYVRSDNKRYQSGQGRGRDYSIAILLVFFALFALLMVVRLFKLQISQHDYYVALASGQHDLFRKMYPERGNIYVQDKEGTLVKEESSLYPVATTRQLNLLYAVPKDIKDPEAVLGALKDTFGLKGTSGEAVPATAEGVAKSQDLATRERLGEEQKIIDKWKEQLVKPGDPYEPLKHWVADTEIAKLKSYNLEGLGWVSESSRYYPEKNIGSQLVGFVGKQEENNQLKGYYGLESCYDKELAGEVGFMRSEKAPGGGLIATAGWDFREAQNGYDLVLTIDKTIEFYACDQLNQGVKKYGAESGSIVAMEPSTGRILALCNSPDFDPNKYNEVKDINIFRNLAVVENYEPGSVFKAITMAAALDTGKVTPFTTYNDAGEVVVSGHVIKNSDLKAHGIQTMTQVLEKSLNTGAVFAARKVGLEEFKRYVEGFGFGKKTNLDVCLEEAGNLKSLDDANEIYLDTASFGQGITVTPIQLVKAFGAIANEGKLVQPYVVAAMKDKAGNIIKEYTTKVVNQIISPQTAQLLGGMLVSAVKNGYASHGGVPGYLVAGKTGTAQAPDLVRGGYSDKTIHTFIGFVPFNKPRLVMVVKLNNPTKANFADSTTAPIFSQVAKFILDYFAVPPEVK